MVNFEKQVLPKQIYENSRKKNLKTELYYFKRFDFLVI